VASILEDTILNNIILGDYYDKEIFNKILDKSLVSNFVDSKNLTINDKIHGTGQNLSGGQIQRLLIARALYRQPKILIIDEGFNQLDNETENKILDSIFEIKDLIIVVIYHNFLKKDMLDKIYTIRDLKLSKIKL
jgi:ABC-type bacteriocin/lantibiotic exporter with double-glycine peptidase domain